MIEEKDRLFLTNKDTTALVMAISLSTRNLNFRLWDRVTIFLDRICLFMHILTSITVFMSWGNTYPTTLPFKVQTK